MRHLDAKNDGMRSYAMKLCGVIVLALSMPADRKTSTNNATLADIPEGHAFLRRRVPLAHPAP